MTSKRQLTSSPSSAAVRTTRWVSPSNPASRPATMATTDASARSGEDKSSSTRNGMPFERATTWSTSPASVVAPGPTHASTIATTSVVGQRIEHEHRFGVSRPEPVGQRALTCGDRHQHPLLVQMVDQVLENGRGVRVALHWKSSRRSTTGRVAGRDPQQAQHGLGPCGGGRLDGHRGAPGHGWSG